MPQSTYKPRHIQARIERSLSHMRIVSVTGARQSGKTTLCQKIAEERGMKFVSLDEKATRIWAQDDPEDFIRSMKQDGGVIDEIQRVPELMLVLKSLVDEDQRPGRFLITGSVDIFHAGVLPDHLAGRLSKIVLYPFAQSEIKGQGACNFLSTSFSEEFPSYENLGVRDYIWPQALQGGYPAALSRKDPLLREEWFTNYVDLLGERYLREDFKVYKPAKFKEVISYAAEISAGLVNLSSMAKALSVNYQTIDRWLWLLEHMYVLRRVPIWHHRKLTRMSKAPKLYFQDPGLLASVRGWDHINPRVDHEKKKPFLESFVFAELTRLISFHLEGTIQLYAYRKQSGMEIDFILTCGGKVVAIEVKASTTPSSDHFKNLRQLQSEIGDDFACGILLHTGNTIHRFGEKLYGVPISRLWSPLAT